MVLVCYLDDAGTDDKNQFVSLSGYIGSIDSWSAFEEATTAVIAEFGTTYIRGRDLWGTRNDFSDWKMNRKIEFISALNDILVRRIGLGLSFATLKSKYDERSLGRTRIQSAFGFSFEMLFHALIKDESFAKVVRQPGVNLSFNIEDGNKNNDEIFQRYERLKRDHGEKLPFFGKMKFVAKKSSLAIQVADLLAFLMRRHVEDMEKNGRKPISEHPYLAALRANTRFLSRASVDFEYESSDRPAK